VAKAETCWFMAEQDIPLVKVLDTKENNIFLEWWRRNCNLKKSKASFFFFLSFFFFFFFLIFILTSQKFEQSKREIA
jgi:hypothetical protein